jgi:hypothetical protein
LLKALRLQAVQEERTIREIVTELVEKYVARKSGRLGALPAQ